MNEPSQTVDPSMALIESPEDPISHRSWCCLRTLYEEARGEAFSSWAERNNFETKALMSESERLALERAVGELRKEILSLRGEATALRSERLQLLGENAQLRAQLEDYSLVAYNSGQSRSREASPSDGESTKSTRRASTIEECEKIIELLIASRNETERQLEVLRLEQKEHFGRLAGKLGETIPFTQREGHPGREQNFPSVEDSALQCPDLLGLAEPVHRGIDRLLFELQVATRRTQQQGLDVADSKRRVPENEQLEQIEKDLSTAKDQSRHLDRLHQEQILQLDHALATAKATASVATDELTTLRTKYDEAMRLVGEARKEIVRVTDESRERTLWFADCCSSLFSHWLISLGMQCAELLWERNTATQFANYFEDQLNVVYRRISAICSVASEATMAVTSRAGIVAVESPKKCGRPFNPRRKFRAAVVTVLAANRLLCLSSSDSKWRRRSAAAYALHSSAKWVHDAAMERFRNTIREMAEATLAEAHTASTHDESGGSPTKCPLPQATLDKASASIASLPMQLKSSLISSKISNLAYRLREGQCPQDELQDHRKDPPSAAQSLCAKVAASTRGLLDALAIVQSSADGMHRAVAQLGHRSPVVTQSYHRTSSTEASTVPASPSPMRDAQIQCLSTPTKSCSTTTEPSITFDASTQRSEQQKPLQVGMAVAVGTEDEILGVLPTVFEVKSNRSPGKLSTWNTSGYGCSSHNTSCVPQSCDVTFDESLAPPQSEQETLAEFAAGVLSAVHTLERQVDHALQGHL